LIRVVVFVVTFVLTLLRLARNLSGPLSDRLGILNVVQLFGGLLQRPGRDRGWGRSWVRLGHGDLAAADSGYHSTLRCAGRACEALARLGAGYLSDKATIVLRVRLLGGDHTALPIP
jgi:hypothetical protein